MYYSFQQKNIAVLDYIDTVKSLNGYKNYVCTELCNRFADGTCDEDRCPFCRACDKKQAELVIKEEQTEITLKKLKISLKSKIVVTKHRDKTKSLFKDIKHSVACALKREYDEETISSLNKIQKFADKANKRMVIYHINKINIPQLKRIIDKYEMV